MPNSGLNRGYEAPSAEVPKTKTPTETEDRQTTGRIARRVFRAGIPALAASLALSPALAWGGDRGARAAAYRDNESRLLIKYGNFIANYRSAAPNTDPKLIREPESLLQGAKYDDACDPQQMTGKATFVRKQGNKVEVTLERRAAVGSDVAVVYSDGVSRPTYDNPRNTRYGFDCADMYDTTFSLQAWKVGKVRYGTRTLTRWLRYNSVKKVDFPEWSPHFQDENKQFTKQPNLTRVDKATINIPRSLVKKGVHLAFVADQTSKIEYHVDRQAFIAAKKIPNESNKRRKLDVNKYDGNNIFAINRPKGYPKR